MNNLDQKGQSLIEVIIAMSVAVIIITALTHAAITSLRNAQYAKNQNLATKYSQEALEVVRAVRDQDNYIDATVSTGNSGSNVWSTIWTRNLGTSGKCFKLSTQANTTTYPALGSENNCSAGNEEQISSPSSAGNLTFYRLIKVSDDGSNLTRKTINVEVYWLDSSGKHSANQTTFLTNWK